MSSNGPNGTISTLGSKLIGGLTPQYLGLLVLNIVFLGCMFWLLVKQNEARERVLQPIVTACAHTVPVESFNLLLKLYGEKGVPAP